MTVEEERGIVHDVTLEVYQIIIWRADEHNVDRDDLIKIVGAMLSTLGEISTSKGYTFEPE